MVIEDITEDTIIAVTTEVIEDITEDTIIADTSTIWCLGGSLTGLLLHLQKNLQKNHQLKIEIVEDDLDLDHVQDLVHDRRIVDDRKEVIKNNYFGKNSGVGSSGPKFQTNLAKFFGQHNQIPASWYIICHCMDEDTFLMDRIKILFQMFQSISWNDGYWTMVRKNF